MRSPEDDKCFTCGCQPYAREGTALLEKAAGQGHAYASDALRAIHVERKEYEHAMKWGTKAAEAGLPQALMSLGVMLDSGKGGAAPDYTAAADWYRRAADAGHELAANNLSLMYTVGRGWVRHILPATSSHRQPSLLRLNWRHIARGNVCQALGRGVTRSKRRAMQWLRKAAENGHAVACVKLATHMYGDQPYAREVGHVGEAAGVLSTGVMEGHDVPLDVLTGVLHWLRKGGHDPVKRPRQFSQSIVGGG